MTPFANSLLTAWHRNGDYALKLVADLSTDQMVYQPQPGMNHPAWVFSHLNAYHPPILAMLAGNTFDDPRNHPFGMLSQPEADPTKYANKQTLTDAFAVGHARITDALTAATNETFAQPMPLERWKSSFPTVGDALGYLMLAHEGIHLGQLSAWRRAQGLPSV